MVYEYALEPELVASWHKDRMKCRFFIDNFGFGTGRVVSDYPKEWAETVWKIFKSSYPKATVIQQKQMAQFLRKIARPTVKRPSQLWDSKKSWHDNARDEHRRRPFYAILMP